MVGLSVCLLVNFVSPTKMAELIKMPFEGLTLVDLRNHVLDGGQDAHGTILGLYGPLKSIRSLCCGVHSNRDDSDLKNDKTATAGVTLHCHCEISPPCDVSFIKLLLPLVIQ